MFEFVDYRVGEVMTSPAVTLGPNDTLRTLELCLEEHGINGCPVVDAAGKMIGFVTSFDLLKAFTLNTRSLAPRYNEIIDMPVERVMTGDARSVSPDLPLTRVLESMVSACVTGFPVTDADRVVGMITRRDVMRALRRASAESEQ